MRRIRRSEAHPLSNGGSDDKAAGKSRRLVLRYFFMAALLTRDFPAVSAAGMDFIARRGYGILYIVPLTQYFR